MQPRGTKDISGTKKLVFDHAVQKMREIALTFDHEPIETPVFEFKETFVKPVGKTSDIVSKEMYVFKDKKNRELALRPEGTAAIVRSAVDNKLLPKGNNYLKVFSFGPYFRYENPQKNRQRQFNTFGVETFGPKTHLVDVETILLATRILNTFKISHKLKLNSLGGPKTRGLWSQSLKKYFATHKSKLSQESLERLETNPLRILDDKTEQAKPFVKNAPRIADFYSGEESAYFKNVCALLKKLDVPFEIDPYLVRGLDYYNDTIFELVANSQNQKAQDALVGGGRYDGLVSYFNPQLSTPAVGFGVGVERVVNELESSSSLSLKKRVDVLVVNLEKASQIYAFEVTQRLRGLNLKVAFNVQKVFNIHKGLHKANQVNAKHVCIVGQKEQQTRTITWKTNEVQSTIQIKDLEKHFVKDSKNEDNF